MHILVLRCGVQVCCEMILARMSAVHVRREKAAVSSGCKPHPVIRSSRKQSEQSWR